MACPDGVPAQQALEAEEKATRPRCRRGAFHVDPKVLEAKVSKRYELFQLPDTIKALFDKPQKEKVWHSLAGMAKYIVDASNGVATANIGSSRDIDVLRDALPPGEARSGLGLQRQVVIGNHICHPSDRLLMPVDGLSRNTTTVRFQRASWKHFPPSSFGEKLCKNALRMQPASLQSLWASHQASMQDEVTATSHNGCFLQLCLDLGQLLWQEQCHQWASMKKAWVPESRVLSCVMFYMQGQRVGDTPVFDGMCANCGHLLYGPVNRNTASTGNKFIGKPRNIKGFTLQQ